jgi:hypothetical protein
MVSEKILTTILNGGGDYTISDKNDNDDIYLLLIGNYQSGKTSIAFNLAYNIALNGGKPLYICNQIKLESKLPMTIFNSDQHLDSILMHTTNTITTNSYEKKRNYNNNSMLPEVLQRINMKYITTIQDLKALIAGLHLFEPRPSVVIIDDLSILIDPLQAINRSDGKFLEIVLRLTSYLQDAMKFLATITPSLPADISTTTSIATNIINHGNLSNNNDDRVSNAEDNSKSSSSTTRKSDRCSDVSRLKVIITDSCRDKLYLQLLSKTMTNILSLQSIPIDPHHTTNLHSTSNRASTSSTTTTATTTVSLTLLKAADYHLCDAAAVTTTTSSTTAATTMMSPSSSSSSSSLSLQLLYSNNSLYVVIK